MWRIFDNVRYSPYLYTNEKKKIMDFKKINFYNGEEWIELWVCFIAAPSGLKLVVDQYSGETKVLPCHKYNEKSNMATFDLGSFRVSGESYFYDVAA